MATPIVMRLNRTWDIKCPPVKKHVVAGKFIPTVKGAFSGRLMQKKRRIAIEIYGPDYGDDDEEKEATGTPKITGKKGDDKGSSTRRGLVRNSQSSHVTDLAEQLMDDDRIVLRILKPRKQWGFSRDHDDSSDSESNEDDDKDKDNDKDKQDDGWVEYRKFGIDEIEQEEFSKNSWEATMGLGANMERREIKFESNDQASDFNEQLVKLSALVKERAQSRLAAFQNTQKVTTATIQHVSRSLSTNNSMHLSAGSDIQLLVEIVSATDLPIADHNSTDPYIIVYMGKQEIHRTKPIQKTLNPIWTVDNGSLFILQTNAEEFFSNATGLTFIIKDHDGISSNDAICKLQIDQTTLLEQTGERCSHDLHSLKADRYGKASAHFSPKLNLRIRPAEKSDREFMKQVFAIKRSKKLGIYADSSFVAPKQEKVGFLKKEKKIVDGVKLYRVKPHPDPTREADETKWLPAKSIDEESLKPTYKWAEAGTGSLGKLYLEVIGCEGLPNMDSGPNPKDKTDAFCCIIYEDAIVNTDVIVDELSPRWVPWCQRGFAFRMAHPSSQVLIGVFDYDSGGCLNSHDAIGRVSIDITNFRRDTDYLLTYDLYRSVLDNDRKTFGTITVRLRLEYDSYRDFVKGSLGPPPLNYINLPQKHDFLTSYFTCNGEENLARFDMNAITSYRTELEGYLHIAYYISQSAVTVVLWRGHYEVRLAGFKVKLPLHSMVVFILGIFLIDNFNLIPSFSLFAMAWLLLATNEFRQRNPSPWHQTMTYAQMWHAVLVNKAPPVEIADHENEAAIKAYEKQNEDRRISTAMDVERAASGAQKLNDFLTDEFNATAEAFNEDMVTKIGGGPSFNPIAIALLPVQQILGQVCKALRIVSSIVLWDESIYAFIIVNVCLGLGIALIWVPWDFFIRWTLRIVIWVLLGPWMKLVDIVYVQKLKREGESETDAFKRLAEAKMEQVGAARQVFMMKKEEVTKLRAMKRFMFGKFVTQVPQLKEYRYPDVPRPESSATRVKSFEKYTISQKSHGQTLVGHMIPTWGDAVDEIKELKEEEKIE